MYDVLIVGAGPAGATLARLLPRSSRVLLLERSASAGKCCGGLIAPDAQALLASFDLGIPKGVVSDPQLLYVRSMDLETGAEGSYQRHYTNVDRGRFDEHLLGLLPENVTLLRGRLYRGHGEEEGGIRVRVLCGEAEEEYRGRILVGADGAYSKVREALYGDFRRLRKYLAIQGEYRRVSAVNHYAVFFDRGLTDFYSWLIPKDESLLLGGAFRESEEPRERYRRLVAAVEAKGYRLGELRRLEACYLLRPRLRDIRMGRGRVALVGEAAGLISPSSSEGLSYAYKSARALARAIEGGDWLRTYRRASLGLRANIALKLLKSRFIYDRLLRNLVFRSRIGSLRRP